MMSFLGKKLEKDFGVEHETCRQFFRAAEREADEAVAWYEKRETGLGAAFRESVEDTILSIQNNPYANPAVHGSKVCRALVDRFPYIVVYSLEADRILIVSVFHTSRNPSTWRGRI